MGSDEQPRDEQGRFASGGRGPALRAWAHGKHREAAQEASTRTEAVRTAEQDARTRLATVRDGFAAMGAEAKGKATEAASIAKAHKADPGIADHFKGLAADLRSSARRFESMGAKVDGLADKYLSGEDAGTRVADQLFHEGPAQALGAFEGSKALLAHDRGLASTHFSKPERVDHPVEEEARRAYESRGARDAASKAVVELGEHAGEHAEAKESLARSMRALKTWAKAVRRRSPKV